MLSPFHTLASLIRPPVSGAKATPDRRRGGVGNDLDGDWLAARHRIAATKIPFSSLLLHTCSGRNNPCPRNRDYDWFVLITTSCLMAAAQVEGLFFVYPFTPNAATHTLWRSASQKNQKAISFNTSIYWKKYSINFLILIGIKGGSGGYGGEGKDTGASFCGSLQILISKVGVDGYIHTYMVMLGLFPFSCWFFIFHFLFILFCFVDGCPRYPCGSCRWPPTISSSLLFFTCSAGPHGLAAGFQLYCGWEKCVDVY
ncbi:hypothetical protein GGI35DRAFT_101066 [Trichoderma velutinum]